MFAYRPRKPMYGGKLAKKKKAEAEAEVEAEAEAEAVAATNSKSKTTKKEKKKKKKNRHPLSPLKDGGPVERAIKSDLVSLRALFNTINANSDGEDEALITRDVGNHAALGSNFLRFKDAFRRGKFGIVHARCVPPRCDRAEYAQMLYAACLCLLVDSFQLMGESEENNDAREDGVSKSRLLDDAVFAVFALYALYETNTLPSFPPLRSDPSSLDLPSHVDSLSEEEKAALTTLPLGLTAAGEQSRVIHRRAYRSPIRIGRGHYIQLMRIRDMSLERTSTCEDRRMEASKGVVKEKQSRNANQGYVMRGHSWKCDCGMSQDSIQVIDRLRTNCCLDLCEYAGPCSLEGLAGSADYYHKVVDPSNVTNKPLEPTILLTTEDLKECLAVDMKSALELDGLEQAFSRYDASIDSIAFQHQRETEGISGRRGQQSNQALLIQESLVPVLRNRRSRSDQSETSIALNTVKRLYVVCDALKANSRDDNCDWLDELYATLRSEVEPCQDASRKSNSIWDQIGSNSDSVSKIEGRNPKSAESTIQMPTEHNVHSESIGGRDIRFVLPSGTTNSLEKGIQAALCGISDELHNVSGHTLPPVGGKQDARSQQSIAAAESSPSRDGNENGNEDEELSFFMQGDDYDDVNRTSSRQSSILGGQAALQQLLSCAVVNEQTEIMAGARRRWQSSMTADLDSGDDASMMSVPSLGVGQSALHLLLSRVDTTDGSREAKKAVTSGGGTKAYSQQSKTEKKKDHQRQPPLVQRTGTKRRRKDPAAVIGSGDDESMMSEPSGVGQNALHLLLSRVDSADGRRGAKQPKKKKDQRQPSLVQNTGTKRRRISHIKPSRTRLEGDGQDPAAVNIGSGDDESMMSEPSGVGQNALHLLLSKID